MAKIHRQIPNQSPILRPPNPPSIRQRTLNIRQRIRQFSKRQSRPDRIRVRIVLKHNQKRLIALENLLELSKFFACFSDG